MNVSSLRNLPDVPSVAIAGRPNVGKSTLFNRFIGSRRAITDPTPGVTRDPVEAEWNVGSRVLHLIDTGGVKLEESGHFDKLVGDKSRDVIRSADCILLLLDVNELTAEDEEIIDFVRPFSEKVFVAVNKVDNEHREQTAWEFHSLGFERVFPVSATHGTGCDALINAVIAFLPAGKNIPDPGLNDKRIKIAILGKPNTGKSTLLNTLTNSRISIVSDIPGTTRDVISGSFMHKGSEYTILDTAGIRKKNRVTENIEYYSVNRAIGTIDEADVVLLVIDALEGLTDQDKKIAGLIVKKGKGVLLVLNKWDLTKKTANALEAMKDRISFVFPVLDFAPVVPISALENSGMDQLLNSVYVVWKELQKRTDTGLLNRHLEKWLSATPPPRWSRGQFKIRYITQVSTMPVEFAIFVNRIKGFPVSYVQYIKNRIRKDLGFRNVPVTIHVRG